MPLHADFLSLDPRNNAGKSDERCNDDSPELDVQDVDVEGSPGRSCNGHECEHERHVAEESVVLVDLLRPVDTSVDSRREELGEANDDLQHQEDVGDDTEDGMWRLQMIQATALLVHLNDDEAREQCENAKVVQDGMDVGAVALLVRRVCGLQDEGGLGDEQHPSRVEQLSRHQRVGQKRNDEGDQLLDEQRRVSSRGTECRPTQWQ